jgi:biotin carboxyl carrier protein
MKTILRLALVATTLIMTLLADMALLAPEAHAIFGVRRRSFRRGVVVGASVGAASASSAERSQQSATAQQQSATAQQQAAAAQHPAAAAAPPAPGPAAAGAPLPLGTVVTALPAGCVSTPVGGVEYYYCGGNFYRAVFQGNSLVYVTAQPK